MRTKAVFAYYKKRGMKRADIARLLDVSRAAVSKWAKLGVMPEGTAYKIESLTGGDLKVDPKLYESKQANVGATSERRAAPG